MGMEIHTRKKLSTVNNHASILEWDMFLRLSRISSWTLIHIHMHHCTVGKIYLNNCSHYHLPFSLSLCYFYSHPNRGLSYIFILKVSYVQTHVCHLNMKLHIFMAWTNKQSIVNCAWLHSRYKKKPYSVSYIAGTTAGRGLKQTVSSWWGRWWKPTGRCITVVITRWEHTSDC